jgi:hypothetical protein
MEAEEEEANKIQTELSVLGPHMVNFLVIVIIYSEKLKV